MGNEMYFLSIHDQYLSKIIDGTKQWEFRANPRFGILTDSEIRKGDLIFCIGTFPGNVPGPQIRCLCRVVEILRSESMAAYFGEERSGHWIEAGCRGDWDYFKREILGVYSTAIRLEAYDIRPAVDVSVIRHRTKRQRTWKGRGFTPARELFRYGVDGKSVPAYFREVADRILADPHTGHLP